MNETLNGPLMTSYNSLCMQFPPVLRHCPLVTTFQSLPAVIFRRRKTRSPVGVFAKEEG